MQGLLVASGRRLANDLQWMYARRRSGMVSSRTELAWHWELSRRKEDFYSGRCLVCRGLADEPGR